jgi:hypothetical protein
MVVLHDADCIDIDIQLAGNQAMSCTGMLGQRQGGTKQNQCNVGWAPGDTNLGDYLLHKASIILQRTINACEPAVLVTRH